MTDPHSHEALLRRVADEIDQGRLWRAKEILLGNIRARPYDPALFEQLGRVLLRMGDTLEAGKYLFLSGVRTAEYAEAIRLFVTRHSRRGALNVYLALPGFARLGSLDAYPEAVREELTGLGLPARFGVPGGLANVAGAEGEPSRVRGVVIRVGCLAALLAAAGVFFLGLVRLAQLVMGW